VRRLRTSPPLALAARARARRLRRAMTPADRALRAGLRAAFPGAHFRYQVPIGRYCADIACHGARLIVEVDGGRHGDARAYDAGRTRFLESRGYTVLRFWNNDVLNDLDGVLAAIAPHLPSPARGEGDPQDASPAAREAFRNTPPVWS
jgi:very-short-patch-repair endonuclease